MSETTDESIIKLTVNKLAYLLVSVVLVTNTVSLTVQRVTQNAEKTEYVDGASKRRLAHSEKEQRYREEILRKDVLISNLKQDLEDCKGK